MKRIATLAVTVAVMASCTVTSDTTAERMSDIRNDVNRNGSLSTPTVHDDGTFSCSPGRHLAAEVDTNLYCVTPERLEYLNCHGESYPQDRHCEVILQR